MFSEDKINTALNNTTVSDELTNNILSFLKSEKYQWRQGWLSCFYLYTFYGNKGVYDKIIMEHMDKLFYMGLTCQNDMKAFLKASEILSRLYFKYGNYKKAGNFLLFLQENSDKNTLPDWVYNYTAKIELKLSPSYVFSSPDKILKHIPLSDENQKDKQRIALYKEFILDAYSYIQSSSDTSLLEKYLIHTTPYIQKALQYILPEWQLFESLLTNIREEKIKQKDYNTIYLINTLLATENETFKKHLLSKDESLKSIKMELDDSLDKINEYRTNIAQLKNELESAKKEENTHKTNKTESEQLLVDKIRDLENENNELINKIKALTEQQKIDGKHIEPVQEDHYEPRILLIGASNLRDLDIYKTAENNHGLSRSSIEIYNDYNKIKHFNAKELQYNSEYDGILVGPVAHKVCGISDYSSLIQMLKSGEGFPPTEEIRTKSGGLKITKSSFSDALGKLLISIQANNPS